MSGRLYALAGEGRLFGLGEHPLWHGHDAARFATRPEMPHRMLAFHLGQAAVFEFHKRDDQYTFCDPRLEVVTRELLEEYHSIELAIEADATAWEKQLDRHDLRMMMVDVSDFADMSATLLSSNQWVCVHFDSVAAIFLNREVSEAARVPGINFGQRLFADRTSAHAANPDTRTGDADTLLHEAKALHGIGLALMKRKLFDIQMTRSILLLAANRARQAADTGRESFELDRLRGQIYLALAPLTGRELRPDDLADFAWDSSTMLDLARGRYFLERSRSQNPHDLSTLVQLFELAHVQNDVQTQRLLRDQLLRVRPRTATQRQVLSKVAEKARSIPETADNPDPELVNNSDWTKVHDAVRQYLSEKRPDRALSLLLRVQRAAGHLPSELDEQRSSLSMLLGSPDVSGATSGDLDASARAIHVARQGTIWLITGRTDQSISSYEAALELDPANIEANFGLSRAYLETGDRKSAHTTCQNALKLPELSSWARHNLEWICEMTE
jgi:tetratricopeptide (TPR) repeat protein